jgi:hypothetical protein
VNEHERDQLAFLLTRYSRHVTTLLLSLGIAKDTNSGFKIFEDILNLLCSMVRFQKIEYDAQNTETDSDDHSDWWFFCRSFQLQNGIWKTNLIFKTVWAVKASDVNFEKKKFRFDLFSSSDYLNTQVKVEKRIGLRHLLSFYFLLR